MNTIIVFIIYFKWSKVIGQEKSQTGWKMVTFPMDLILYIAYTAAQKFGIRKICNVF